MELTATIGVASVIMLAGLVLALTYGWMYSTQREPPAVLLKAALIAVVLGMGMGGFLDTESLTDNVPQENEIELAELKAQTKMHPTSATAWLRYATKAKEAGDTQEAMEAWRTVLELEGSEKDKIEAARSLVLLHMHNGQKQGLQTARDVLESLFAKGEKDFGLHELYADLCMKTGNWAQANKTYDALLMRLTIDDARFKRIAAAASEAAKREREALQR